MGCVGSTAKEDSPKGKKVVKPKAWKHPTPLSQAELTRMREEFWDTAPHYGGQREIWDALKAATDGDRDMAQVILESAGVVVDVPDMSVCYDERGASWWALGTGREGVQDM
ncbi:unnamed protein product [Closterium sp. Naga37s-1]|nr:unnamed protein product [Closterium sp. Naga37s-1]